MILIIRGSLVVGINKPILPVENNHNLLSCFREIERTGLLVREIEIVYRKKNDVLLIHPGGLTSMSLSDEFINQIKTQFNKLIDNVVMPLIKFTKESFTLSMKVNARGQFSFDTMTICFKPDAKKGLTTIARFHKAFRLFAHFAEHLEFFSVSGRKYSITNINATAVLNIEDLHEIIEQPTIPPKLRAQWFNFISEAEAETKKQFSLDIQIPCFEGEVVWQTRNNYVRLHHLENLNSPQDQA